MDWDDLRHFLALARLGSVRAAGAHLGVSHSTVARRVQGLEAKLKTRLFDRNREGYHLTEAGQQMMPVAERVEGEMAALEREILGQDDRLEGTVALTCCDIYVSGVLVEGLTGFCHDHPEIELKISTDSRAFDLSKREADIAIRTLGAGRNPPEHLIGKQLAPVTVANYVAVDHADRLDPERVGEETRWVAFEDRRFLDMMVASGSYPEVPTWGAFSSLPLLLQATRAGLGIAMLPTYVGDTDPGLRRLAQPDLRHVADLWLLSHVDLRDNARFRASRAAIREVMEQRMAVFRGVV